MGKLLVISHWYYPRNNPRSFRARALVDEFNRIGLECDVLVGESQRLIKYNHLFNYYDSVSDNTRQGKTENSKLKSLFRSFVRLVVGEKFIIFDAKKVEDIVRNIDDKYDAIISIGNPFYVHLATSKLKKQCSMIIADCGDPFYSGLPKHSKIVEWIQKSTFKKYDFITIPIENAKSYYSKYIQEDKIKVIPQGFSTSGINIKNYTENQEKPIKFAYAGAFYEDIRNPENLLKILSEYEDDYKFVLYTSNSGAVYEKVLLKYKNILGEKIVIKPFMQRERCIEELSEYDFLVNIQNTVGIQAPSKLIDYAIAKRPIISIRPDSVDIDNLYRFLHRDYSGQTIVDIDKYKIENVAKQFVDLMKTKL